MYVVERLMTRPNSTVTFLKMNDSLVSEEVKEHWLLNYKSNGKCIHVDMTESETELSIIEYWDQESYYNEYMSDPYMIANLFNLRTQYWTTNNITNQFLRQETI